MTGIESMIAQLERQKTALEEALAALRELGGEAPIKRRGRPQGSTNRTNLKDGRQRQIEAMRAYWAKKKAGTKKGVDKSPAKKRRLTAAGRKALSDNMQKMWAKKRAPGSNSVQT